MSTLSYEDAARIVAEIATGTPENPYTHEQVMQAICVVLTEWAMKMSKPNIALPFRQDEGTAP